jgi:hypothetical protein
MMFSIIKYSISFIIRVIFLISPRLINFIFFKYIYYKEVENTFIEFINWDTFNSKLVRLSDLNLKSEMNWVVNKNSDYSTFPS